MYRALPRRYVFPTYFIVGCIMLYIILRSSYVIYIVEYKDNKEGIETVEIISE